MPSRQRSQAFIAVMSRLANRMRPALGGKHPGNQIEQCGLAGAVRPQNAKDLRPASTLKSSRSDHPRPPKTRDEVKRVRSIGGLSTSLAGVRFRRTCHRFGLAAHRDVRARACCRRSTSSSGHFLPLRHCPRDNLRQAGVRERALLEIHRADNDVVVNCRAARRGSKPDRRAFALHLQRCRSATSRSEWRKPRPIEACLLASFS